MNVSNVGQLARIFATLMALPQCLSPFPSLGSTRDECFAHSFHEIVGKEELVSVSLNVQVDDA